MLLQYLPDTRGVIGLGALGSRRAEPALVQLFEAEQGSDSSEQIYLAKALWQIRPDPRWLEALIEVLASADESIGNVGERGCKSPRKRPPSVVQRSKQPGNASWSHRTATQID
jgi:hypothetical protein